MGDAPAFAQRIVFPSVVGQDPAAFSVPTAPLSPPPPPTLPSFDPYSTTQAPVLIQQPIATQPGIIRPDGTVVPYQKLVEQIRFEGSYLPKFSSTGLGFNTLEMSATFAFPAFQRQPPLFVTPGFATHWFDGPESGAFPNNPDLPPRVYDVYLDTAWQPIFNERWSADLGFRIGVYSDFSYVNSHSLRYISRGLGLYRLNPAWQAAAGIVYIDRNLIKLLPAFGLIWTPNEDTRWEILFPRPKLAKRLTTYRASDVWGYFSGEYGGGAWTITRADGLHESMDYNDIRFNLGIETRGKGRLNGWFEVGFVFDRQVQYRLPTLPGFRATETVMLRGGLSY